MKKIKLISHLFLLSLLLMFHIFANSALSQPITLVTVGDSLTAGDGDNNNGGGYPARLRDMLTPLYPGTTLSNIAISGDTTQDLINKQLDRAVVQLNDAPADTLKIALIWIGSNDLFGLYNGDVCSEYYSDLSTCEEMEMNYAVESIHTILSRLKATGADLYIALLDDQTRRPVIANASFRADTFPGITTNEIPRMATQLVAYNGQIQHQAQLHDAVTVDFFNTTIFETNATLDHDGNHPNSAGYDAIATIWFEAITGTTPDPSDTPVTPDPTPDPWIAPIPCIFSNGNHESISVTTEDTTNVFVSMDAGDMLNQHADWWIVHVTPDNKIFSLTLSLAGELIWNETIAPVLSIPLLPFENIPIFSETLPLSGTYTFYFGVDNQADGVLAAPMWVDTLTIQVAKGTTVFSH